MTTTIEVIKAIRDYGVNAVLVIAVIWMNGRVSEVENKLEDCYQLRIEEKGRFNFPIGTGTSVITGQSFAILPEEIKIKKIS